MIDARRYIESAPVPLALVGPPDARVRVANVQFAEALDTTPDALAERSLAELFADPDAVRARIREIRETADGAASVPMTNSRGNSVLFTAWEVPEAEDGTLAVLLAADHGSGKGPAGPLDDTLREVNEALLITALEEQSEAEEARAESEAKSVFLASVSHELRTPLNSILGYADLLSAGVPERLPEPLESHVDRIRRAAQHLLSLIEQIIEASRAEFDDRVDAERFDIAGFIPDVVDLVRDRAERSGLALQVRRSSDHLEVVSDRRKIRQILLNLLVNAIKFTDEGHVRVELEHDDDSYTLRVSDTGIGMSQEDQERVFRRFWQAGGSAVRTEGGMGIGLWVVRTLVDAMGGDVSVASTPGEGSTFTVNLPREPRPAPASAE